MKVSEPQRANPKSNWNCCKKKKFHHVLVVVNELLELPVSEHYIKIEAIKCTNPKSGTGKCIIRTKLHECMTNNVNFE